MRRRSKVAGTLMRLTLYKRVESSEQNGGTLRLLMNHVHVSAFDDGLCTCSWNLRLRDERCAALIRALVLYSDVQSERAKLLAPPIGLTNFAISTRRVVRPHHWRRVKGSRDD